MLLLGKQVALKSPGNDCDGRILFLPLHMSLFNALTVL